MSKLSLIRKKIFSASLVFAAFLIAASPVSAIPEGLISFYSSNDILFYDPDAKEIYCGTTGNSGLTGADNLEKIYNYFIGQGLADYLAAAVVGNIAIESGGDPTIAQTGGNTNDPSVFGTKVGVSKAWGLIQWDAGGRAIEFAKQANITAPIYELATQLDLIWWHMNTLTPTGAKGFIDKFKATSDVDEATLYFRKNLEGAWTGHDTERIVAAKLALETYGNNLPAASAAASVGMECSGAVSGNLLQTVLNYTAHEYHSPNYFEMTPAYQTAISTAIANGEYVGGSTPTDSHPGIDCGGFVTRVMRDSGVDPNYGGGGNTVSQLDYLVNSPEYTEINPTSTNDMQPGDIAIKVGSGANGERHTYMYVGNITGFETTVASASISYSGNGWRAPMAGREKPADPSYRWFRKV